jgi:competence protein ComEC
MKTYLLGFSLGGLFASTSLASSFIATPFVLVVAAYHSKRAFTFVLMVVLGFSWVLIHLYLAEHAALGGDVKPYRDSVSGSIARVIHKSNKVEFDLISPQGKIKTSCYRCQLVMSDGDHWKLALRIKPILNLHNPEGFDYRKWMLSKGYIAKATVDSKSISNTKLYGQELSVRGYVSSIVSVDQMPMLRALLLGDKSGLKASDQRLINRAGISHLFVVSGLHISLAAFMVVIFFAWLQRPLIINHWRYSQVIGLILGLSMAFLYGHLSGMNTPAIRALIMLLCAFLILWGRQNIPAIVYWLFALVFVLVVSPLAFLNLGAWLSFGIVLSLIVGMSGLNESLGGHLSNNWINRRLRVIKRYSLGLVRAQWFAVCAGGVVLMIFNVPISPVSFVLNLFLIPIVSLVLVPLAFMGVIIAVIGDVSLLLYCEQAIASFLQCMHGYTQLISRPLYVHDENRYLVACAFLMLLVPRALKVYPLAWVLIVVALNINPNRPLEGGFSLIVFDVGQGSSALVTTNNHSILIDTGYGKKDALGMSDYIVLPYLRKAGITALDKVFLTHNDADHAGGIEALQPLIGLLIRQDDCPDKKWVWDEVVFYQFQSQDYKKGNNGTCLLKVESKSGASVLFAGDIEKKAEESLIKHKYDVLDSNVLIVPHHGSKTSSSSGFLKAVNPDVAIVSAGRLNHFGHPHPEVIERYKQRLVKIYSTGSHGAVEVEFSPRQAARIVSTYRPKDQYE